MSTSASTPAISPPPGVPVRPGERGVGVRARQVLAVLALLLGGAYLVWRVGWTGDGALVWTFWLLVAAEAFGWLSLALYAFMAWKVPETVRPAIVSPRTVDVFVTTYDESVPVVHATLVGCRAIRHPHTTWLLDDGRRPEMEALAESMGARYLTRADNAHAKAGNINAALTRTEGDLILTLDADHVPFPDILDATVGYFEDESVALVQTPHDFANRDSMQHTRPDRHEQSLFYEVIAPGKGRHGAAFWCGSATVIRRAALEEVGGVQTETVAEDFHTTLAMHAAGWSTRYHHETLVQGLAPHDLAGFLLQRDRWARGNLRVFRTRENPVTCPNLTVKQRLSYTASLLNYFSAYQRLALLVVLIVTLVSGRLPLHADPVALLALWLPWTVAAFASTLALGRGRLGPLDASRYGLLTMAIFARAAGVLFTRKVGTFKVTPKEGTDAGGVEVLRAAKMVVAFAAVLAVAVVARAVAAVGWLGLPPLVGFALWVTLALGAYELWVMLWTLGPLVRRRQLRHDYRYPVQLSGRVDGGLVRVRDLSTKGAGLDGLVDRRVGDIIELRLWLPDSTGTVRENVLVGLVRSRRTVDGHMTGVGVMFDDLDRVTRDRLVEYLAVVRGAEVARRGSPVEAPASPTGEASAEPTRFPRAV
ncbi:glycosyltransferase family 2 protein [Rhabdothermincola salaria]|uniref:glycosyltransferase family 2 protein n=1 Tax=Rhabdothermincola salaria TaxID=2903142 RepID=UPI001E4FBD36|nr:glycosyltransferase [Rhabdothermincola salaria]